MNRVLFGLFALAAALQCGLAQAKIETDNDVLVLTEDNFDEAIKVSAPRVLLVCCLCAVKKKTRGRPPPQFESAIPPRSRSAGAARKWVAGACFKRDRAQLVSPHAPPAAPAPHLGPVRLGRRRDGLNAGRRGRRQHPTAAVDRLGLPPHAPLTQSLTHRPTHPQPPPPTGAQHPPGGVLRPLVVGWAFDSCVCIYVCPPPPTKDDERIPTPPGTIKSYPSEPLTNDAPSPPSTQPPQRALQEARPRVRQGGRRAQEDGPAHVHRQGMRPGLCSNWG